jgi:NifU-like protein involved in Fe-S cluster formation
MADRDLNKLYPQMILELAASIPHAGRLPEYDASVRKRSPLCGSTVTVDVVMRDGRVAGFGQDVKACALGQAAASVLGSHVIGRTRSELETLHRQMLAMLKENGAPPGAPFEQMALLEPARDYKNRHASIMLAIDATVEAAEKAEEEACARSA